MDDDADYQAVLRSMLRRSGYEVEECRFGGNVLHRLLFKDIDLVVLDYIMPDQKGDRISLNIRSIESLKELPIIIVTGHSEMGEEFFKSMGADAVIYKPVNYEELIAAVEKFLPDSS